MLRNTVILRKRQKSQGWQALYFLELAVIATPKKKASVVRRQHQEVIYFTKVVFFNSTITTHFVHNFQLLQKVQDHEGERFGEVQFA